MEKDDGARDLGTVRETLNADMSKFGKGIKKAKSEVKKATVEPQPPVALKSCRIRSRDGSVIRLTRGQPVAGLTSRELNRLKAHNFVK
ncbi:MAG: hypothetical protein M0R06_17875 [Sphaerochaeta sp.]|nr:hypothetical protein [Sphaerochaeta sp.]